MASRERKLETHTEPSAISVRYWQMYEDLPAEGNALSYPCRWDEETSKWKKLDVAQENLQKIYDRPKGSGAKEGDIVATVWTPRSRHWELLDSGPGIFRGITDAQINKGDDGTVSRYKAGTNTDSEIDDTVWNDWADIGSGIKVMYVKLGGTFYIINSEKSQKTLITNFREKGDGSAIEGEQLAAFVDTVATAAYADKVTINECP